MDVREALIASGTRLLETNGIESLTLRTIAREAGVSHGAPRHHFPIYASLLAAIARTGLEDLDAELGPALSDPDPARGIRVAAAAYLDFAVRRPEMFALITRHDLLEGQGAELRAITGRWVADLGRSLARARGRRRPDPAATLALWSGVHGLAALTSRRTTEPVGLSSPERALALIVDRALA